VHFDPVRSEPEARIQLVSMQTRPGFFVLVDLEGTESLFAGSTVKKLRGPVRTWQARLSSKIEKRAKDWLRAFFQAEFHELAFARRSALELDLHPAWLEPTTL
jgi:hypothetical protein